MRLTVEKVKERQEYELINNSDYGLLNNVDPAFKIQARQGAPTPDDLDELLSRIWKEPAFFLAHPRAIAAFGRECTSVGFRLPRQQFLDRLSLPGAAFRSSLPTSSTSTGQGRAISFYCAPERGSRAW